MFEVMKNSIVYLRENNLTVYIYTLLIYQLQISLYKTYMYFLVLYLTQ